ncbi:MAG TPA: tautomerase family protein [Tepidisphaeraceae bacterium]|nr:tautomerase family protein [Tepidisphaeraceae bacterium]
MPHVTVKMWPGPSEQQKRRLADQITKDVVTLLDSDDASVSVAIEEVNPGDWLESVYRREIEPRMDDLYKRPGYGPSDL